MVTEDEATIIRAPWCDSEIVAERRVVKKFKDLWPLLATLPDQQIIARLRDCGFDARRLKTLEAILERQQKRQQQKRA